jgi:hypothetical protein
LLEQYAHEQQQHAQSQAQLAELCQQLDVANRCTELVTAESQNWQSQYVVAWPTGTCETTEQYTLLMLLPRL